MTSGSEPLDQSEWVSGFSSVSGVNKGPEMDCIAKEVAQKSRRVVLMQQVRMQ